MTLEIRHRAEEVHFTLPESLWCKKGEFFKSFGFSSAMRASRQYRHGDTELMCSAPLSAVWSASLEKLPRLITKFTVGGYSLGSQLLMSIKPKYAEKLFSGTKLVEIRRRFARRWVGCRVAFYASKPLSALVGEATINSVTCGRPDDIWADFGWRIGCSFDEFETYTTRSSQVCAIELSNVLPYRSPLPLAQMVHLSRRDLKPPQSFRELNLERNGGWAIPVSVASLLHVRLGFGDQRIAHAACLQQPLFQLKTV
jgi:predicted transcriptional regulator